MTQSAPTPQKITVVVFGDSITAAKEVTDYLNHLFAVALSRGDEVRVVNASAGGRPAAAAAGLVESLVLPHQPDLVVVQYGFNDMRHDANSGRLGKPISTPKEFAGHLTRIAEQLRAANARTQILILGNHRSDSCLVLPTGRTYEETRKLYTRAARQVTRKLKTHFLDMEAAFAKSPHSHTDFLCDMVHLSPRGQWWYAMALANKIQEIIYKPATKAKRRF